MTEFRISNPSYLLLLGPSPQGSTQHNCTRSNIKTTHLRLIYTFLFILAIQKQKEEQEQET